MVTRRTKRMAMGVGVQKRKRRDGDGDGRECLRSGRVVKELGGQVNREKRGGLCVVRALCTHRRESTHRQRRVLTLERAQVHGRIIPHHPAVLGPLGACGLGLHSHGLDLHGRDANRRGRNRSAAPHLRALTSGRFGVAYVRGSLASRPGHLERERVLDRLLFGFLGSLLLTKRGK